MKAEANGHSCPYSTKELASLVKEVVVGYQGEIVLDPSKPDGTPRKLLDISRLKGLGWESKIELRAGITKNYQWHLEHLNENSQQKFDKITFFR